MVSPPPRGKVTSNCQIVGNRTELACRDSKQDFRSRMANDQGTAAFPHRIVKSHFRSTLADRNNTVNRRFS